METVKLAIALVPVSLLLFGSVVLLRTTQSMWVSFQGAVRGVVGIEGGVVSGF